MIFGTTVICNCNIELGMKLQHLFGWKNFNSIWLEFCSKIFQQYLARITKL